MKLSPTLDADGLDNEDPRRWPEVGLSCRRPSGERVSATILVTETDVVAGVNAGRRTLETRRGVTGFSRSTDFRLGDEWEECMPSPRRSEVGTVLRRVGFSVFDAFGTEEETAAELELLDRFDPGLKLPCLPLPVLGVFIGLVERIFDLPVGVVLAALLFFLVEVGVDGFDDREVGDDGWELLALYGIGRGRNLRMASISAGTGVRWTMLTAGQSKGLIFSNSWGYGARQQPGHPGLLYPDCLGGGSMFAHCG